jgi:cobalt/nickel transport protein
MRKLAIAALALTLGLALAAPALAHFGMIIPDRNIVGKEDPKTVNLHYLFWHPMENQGMDLAKPLEAGCLFAGQKVDMLASLKEKKVAQKTTWTASLAIKKPADYIFYLNPAPYWEPAEDKFIVHHTKTIVSALGAQEGWEQPVGQKVEIIPLARPYGLYAGNAFSGQVLFKGKPLAGAEVEVEFYNEGGKRKAPGDAYTTQVVKTDLNGQFTWSFPWAGWWGLAALTDDDEPLKKDGQDKKVEVGGVLWLYVHPVK